MGMKLGHLVGVSVVLGAFALVGASGAGASGSNFVTTETSIPESTTTIESTTSVETTTTTTVETTTTTTTLPPPVIDPPMVVEVPPPPVVATPERGTAYQATDTLPPPPTTTTTSTLPPDALPLNSGTGRRVVYSKSAQRVWIVEEDDSVSKTHLVSGRRTWNQPLPGEYSVFSRSLFTCNIKNPALCWRYMVRFTKGPDGDNIGFHEIPTNNDTGVRVQSDSQLGTPLSGGCIRQATPDALYMWNWAYIGSKVVVLG
jgi:lipoprotein-anchoring transpeptidase ErfK/SrfK